MSLAAPARDATGYLAADHTHLHASYNMYFVALSYGLAVLGSFAALASAPRIREHVGFRRLGWSAVTGWRSAAAVFGRCISSGWWPTTSG